MRYAAQFEQHGSRFYDGYPTVRLTFSLTHSRFERTSGDRFLRENPNINTAFTAHVLSRRNSAGFDRLTSNVTCIKRLKCPVSKNNSISSGRATSYTPSLAFAMLDPLWH
jgi:hypothetical protein